MKLKKGKAIDSLRPILIGAIFGSLVTYLALYYTQVLPTFSIRDYNYFRAPQVEYFNPYSYGTPHGNLEKYGYGTPHGN